jgi:hypothetical protein
VEFFLKIAGVKERQSKVLSIKATRGVGSADTSKELTVKSKKTPAPQRAGTTNRARREIAAIEMLDEIRERDPVAFGELMQLLASLTQQANAEKSRP